MSDIASISKVLVVVIAAFGAGYLIGTDTASSDISVLERENLALKNSENLNIPELVTELSTSAKTLRLSVEQRKNLADLKLLNIKLQTRTVELEREIETAKFKINDYSTLLLKANSKIDQIFKKEKTIDVKINKTYELVPNDVYISVSQRHSTFLVFGEPNSRVLNLGGKIHVPGELSRCVIRFLEVSDETKLAKLRYNCEEK